VRVALVTGAAQGIGLVVARRLEAIGHRVVMLDRDAAILSASADSMTAETIVGDVADPASVADTMAQIRSRFGRLDIVINNAGICPAHDGQALPVETMDLDEWNRVIAVNLTGTFLVCRAALPMMKAGGWGRIVNFSSMGGRMRSLLSGAHYAATKAGVIGFTRVLAGQVGREGITANCIAPGRIDTQQSADFGNVDRFLEQLPLGRIGGTDEIAAGVEYLVSDAAGYVTGTVLDINGGHYMV